MHKTIRLFIDTEFVSFDYLEPLSIGLYCPTNSGLNAYFERLDYEHLLRRHDESALNFLRTEVLPQLGKKKTLGDMREQGVAVTSAGFAEVQKSVQGYFERIRASLRKDQRFEVWADFSGDFDVLKQFLGKSTNPYGIIQIDFWEKLMAVHSPEMVASMRAKLEGECPYAFLNRHHAFRDAWVLGQKFSAF